MTRVTGVDACRAGWLAVAKDTRSGAVSWALYATIQELLRAQPAPAIFAINIPIGLLRSGVRECDVEARALLGKPRSSSVLPVPVRAVLRARSYPAACAVSIGVEGKKITKQAWSIVPNVRTVDAALRANGALAERVYEVHAELSYMQLAGGRAMKESKASAAGLGARRRLLAKHFAPWLAQVLAERRALGSAEDDVLDAFAALWTAERIAAKKQLRVPARLQRDEYGLRIQISA